MVHVETIKAYSFLDYVRGGTELACTISLDFTQSNGAPNDPRSLHFINPRAFNQYELAIKSVGEIIEDYDSDKLFPVLGFGARLPPDGRVSHCFYVNLHDSNPYCERIPGKPTLFIDIFNKDQNRHEKVLLAFLISKFYPLSLTIKNEGNQGQEFLFEIIYIVQVKHMALWHYKVESAAYDKILDRATLE